MRTRPGLLESQGKDKNILLCSEIICIFVAERTVLLRLVVYSKRCLHIGLHISDGYFAIAPPETPISLRSSL